MISKKSIDLNCDMGESNDEARIATDLALLKSVTSINIACGGHAGDAASMERTVQAAIEAGVAVGAHPSYPDRENFGRKFVGMPIREIERCVYEQIASLAQVCARIGVRMTHVKPHGALYHCAMTRIAAAEAIARAARQIDASLILVGLAGCGGFSRWKTLGFDIAEEAFADRNYENDGSLRERLYADAIIIDSRAAASQAVSIATQQSATAVDGSVVSIKADTLCIHSDTPGAAEHARLIRSELERSGVRVAALR